MRVRFLISLLVISISVGLFSNTSLAVSQSELSGLGSDVSWPNCNATPPNISWGIVGTTGGLDFTDNPCVYKESQWFDRYALYMNTGYPGTSYALKFSNYPLSCKNSSKFCLPYDYGYNAALFALRYSALQGVYSNLWWLDVETVNSWTSNTSQNNAALKGMIAAIKANTLLTTIGFYSDSSQWTVITGDWINKYPDWIATGSLSMVNAIEACTQSFTGGSTLFTQFTLGLDKDYLCKANSISNLVNK